MNKKKEKRIGYLHSFYRNAKSYSDFQNNIEINAILSKYREIAKSTEQPDWYVKRAEIYFMYENEAYVIGPGFIDNSGEIFDVLSNDIIDDLYSVGAYHMFYAGMID